MNSLAVKSPGDYPLTFKSSYDQSTQPYRLYIPSAITTGNKLPVVVVLHGKWVDQNAWFDYTPIKQVAEERGYIAIAPYGRGNYFYRGPGEQDVLDLIALAKKELPVNEDRVYLMGHSMGGWGTWWVGLRNPKIFASICPMSGMVPIDLVGNAKYLHPLIIHDATDPIVPVDCSRQPVAELEKLRLDYQYIEPAVYGHDSRMIGDYLPKIMDWFEKHPRGQNNFRPIQRTCPVSYKTILAKWNPNKTDRHPKELSRVIAMLLKTEIDVDYALLHEDMFVWPIGDITADKIMDTYVYPEERFAVITLNQGQFDQLTTKLFKDSPLMAVTPYPELKSWSTGTAYRFIAPLNIARAFDADAEPLPKPIRDYLIKAIQKHKVFPPEF